MFGMGGSEILVILIVALLFLGPDKLPDAAKQISKGIRDLKKQTRVLQETIENDEHIGGAIRDIKSALRGDEIQPRPAVRKPGQPAKLPEGAVEAAPGEASNAPSTPSTPNTIAPPAEPALTAADATPAPAAEPVLEAEANAGDAAPEEPAASAKPPITLPAMVGEADPITPDEDDSPENLAALIKPAAGTVAKNG